MSKRTVDSAMTKVRTIFKESGLSLQELGMKMEYPQQSARKSAWQFLAKTDDPRLSMLRRFAKAVGVDVRELL